MSMDSELHVSQLLKHETNLFDKVPLPLHFTSPWSISSVVRYKCVCWELSLFQNQVRRLKCLIICEVGLKLFPLLGDSIKWLSVEELHQIPRVNKSSSQPQQLFEGGSKAKTRRNTAIVPLQGI